MEKVYEIYIKTTPERLWEAITDPAIRRHYNFGAGVESDWTPGSRIAMGSPSAPGLLGEGEVLEADPPRRLVHTLVALWGDDVKAEGSSRVTWEIEPVGDSCRLLVTHDQLREGANEQLYGGWPMILSGLKTWLESGELLTTPGVADVRLANGVVGSLRRWTSPSRSAGSTGTSRSPVARTTAPSWSAAVRTPRAFPCATQSSTTRRRATTQSWAGCSSSGPTTTAVRAASSRSTRWRSSATSPTRSAGSAWPRGCSTLRHALRSRTWTGWPTASCASPTERAEAGLEVHALVGFSWGFTVRGEEIDLVPPAPLGPEDWDAHGEILSARYPAWRFVAGYRQG